MIPLMAVITPHLQVRHIRVARMDGGANGGLGTHYLEIGQLDRQTQLHLRQVIHCTLHRAVCSNLTGLGCRC